MQKVLIVAILGLYGASGQASKSQGFSLDQTSLKDNALLLADALVKHPPLFKKILKILDAGTPLLGIGNHDPNVEFLKENLLDVLPRLVGSSDNAAILSIISDELSKINVTDVIAEFQRLKVSQDDPEAKKNLTDAIYARYDVTRALQRILGRRSVRSYLPLSRRDDIDTDCYKDLMDFFDAIPGVQLPPKPDFRFAYAPWVIQMLDAYGKPSSGILDTELNWLGSREECHRIHAHLVPGVSFGNKTLTSPINFRGKFCQVNLQLPVYIKSILNKFQRSEQSLRWDVCVPDICSGNDVAEFLQLGGLQILQLNPTSVVCDEVKKTLTANESQETFVSAPNIFRVFNTCIGHNSGLSESSWKQCLLSLFDRNGDGRISRDEWTLLDKRDNSGRYFMSLDINSDLQIDEKDLHYFFRFFDDNYDGRLTILEVETNWRQIVWSAPPVDIEDPEYLLTSPVLHRVVTSCGTPSSVHNATWIHCFISSFDTDSL